tara:strand:- start:123 stop:329 length:207 start_codon:yes stop_codon:yes gene_type:complete
MAIKRPKPEEIVVNLRQVEVLMGQGMPQIGLDVMMDGSSWLMQSATALRVISSKGAVRRMRTRPVLSD